MRLASCAPRISSCGAMSIQTCFNRTEYNSDGKTGSARVNGSPRARGHSVLA